MRPKPLYFDFSRNICNIFYSVELSVTIKAFVNWDKSIISSALHAGLIRHRPIRPEIGQVFFMRFSSSVFYIFSASSETSDS